MPRRFTTSKIIRILNIFATIISMHYENMFFSCFIMKSLWHQTCELIASGSMFVLDHVYVVNGACSKHSKAFIHSMCVPFMFIWFFFPMAIKKSGKSVLRFLLWELKCLFRRQIFSISHLFLHQHIPYLFPNSNICDIFLIY